MSFNSAETGWTHHLVALASLAVPPDRFWQQFSQFVAEALGASNVEIFSRDSSKEDGPWVPLTSGAMDFTHRVSMPLLQNARKEGLAVTLQSSCLLTLAIIPTSTGSREVVLLLTHAAHIRPETLLPRVAALSLTPLVYERSREARLGGRDALRLTQSLILMGNLLDTTDFNSAATTLVNRLAELFACEQVFLTWRKLGGQRLVSVSHGDIPEHRSPLAAEIEELGQDAIVQRAEIFFPPREGDAASNAAERFAESGRPGNVIALPITDLDASGKSIEYGAVILTRKLTAFTEAEQWALRLFVEMIARILVGHADNRRLLPIRLGREAYRSLPRIFQVKTSQGRKLILCTGAIAVAALLFPVPYSITATAVLKTEAVAFVGAPFNGYIDNSEVLLGDAVRAGDVLVNMATEELILDREVRLAELAQANRDAEISRSLGKLSEMQVARARAEESKAHLGLLDSKIEAATVVAPINGVVVEGEPSKKIGQAVTRGDMLVTLAQVDGLYAEAAILERDLNYVDLGAHARLTLLANPDRVYHLVVDRTIPSVRTQDGQNVFPVRLGGASVAPEWWLPGMTGVVKIDAGYRPIVWSAMRRFSDYLRLKFWL